MTAGRPSRSLSAESALTVLLVLLAVRLFVVPVLVPGPEVRTSILTGLFGIIMAVGILAVARSRLVTFVWIALVSASVATTMLVRRSGGHLGLELLADAVDVLTLVAITAAVLVRVNRSGDITAHRIRGAIAAYLLVAVVFATGYQIVDRTVPGSFEPVERPGDPGSRRDGFFYYSMVTLTTTGYGDITPRSPAARSLAMLEALIGQLYPAILIARLVTLEIESRRTGTSS